MKNCDPTTHAWRKSHSPAGHWRNSLGRGLLAVMIVLLPPLYALRASGADVIVVPLPGGKAYPADGVLFGTPPADDAVVEAQALASAAREAIIAEYEVAGGLVRFVDEGDSVSTVVKGGARTFEVVATARTVGDLFVRVAPIGSVMPRRIAEVRKRPLDRLVAIGDGAEGPTLDNEVSKDEDDWAEGCSGDAIGLWQGAFEDWHGFLVLDDDTFSTSTHWDFGFGMANDAVGYFGSVDEIWLAVCMVSGVASQVQIEHRIYSTCDAVPGGWACGSWAPVVGTTATLSAGERYRYHNHSIYSGLRRAEIVSIGNDDIYGWQYFVSAAGDDSFAPDEQLTSPD
ncbi:MAG: hypothetical protein KDG52_17355 [Rhodocyclaceae bacterium]|nr:hypothetical protein [Rhodocyclaceae bacterium]